MFEYKYSVYSLLVSVPHELHLPVTYGNHGNLSLKLETTVSFTCYLINYD